MEMFLISHYSYDYDQSCNEIESIQKEKDESMGDFILKISQIYYKFYDVDRSLEEYFHQLCTYLLHISLREEEHLLLFDESNST